MKINKDDEHYKERLKIATKAFNSGCVIYSSSSQKYFTPREFLDSDEIVEYRVYSAKEYPNVTLHYPRHAIERQLSDLKEAQIEFESFMNRMLTAFDLKPTQVKSKDKS